VPESIFIREGTLDDAGPLNDLAYTTFWDAFAAHPKNAPDDLAEYMERAFSAEQIALGTQVRTLFASRGIPSVAASGYQAPGVVVSYTRDPEIHNSKKFLALGLQTAAGVPLQCDEPTDFMTFRVGLFGLEKWHHVERTVAQLAQALDQLGLVPVAVSA
jgi:aspartate aminotransferase-like enzyme